MQRYYIEEHVPCIMVTARYVDARNKAEAVEKFECADSEPVVFEYSEHDYDRARYLVSVEKQATKGGA